MSGIKVYVGEAIHDENNKARGGEPGDQTGREVCVREWRLNQNGWRVFRAKDPTVAEKIAYDMRAACANPFIGYDQTDRRTLYEVSKPLGFDCTRVTTPCECDCSSLVQVCVLYAGVKVGSFNTASEAEALLKTGAFIELTGEKYTESPDFLRTGDILVTKTKGHTCVVLNDGPKADPLPDPKPEPEPEPSNKYVLIKGGSVRVRDNDGIYGRCIGIVHRGEEYPYIETAPSGWYKIKYNGFDAYVTGKPRYTEVIFDA